MDNRMSSCLFTLRLWHEQLGEGQMEWRGKVQYTDSGNALYFRQWGVMLEFLQETLEQIAPQQEPVEDGNKLDLSLAIGHKKQGGYHVHDNEQKS